MTPADSTAPLTREHLLLACEWAERGLPTIGGAPRVYDQSYWDCGTACCLHGAAHLAARGTPATYGPQVGDYTDLAPDVRAGVLSVLCSPGGTPALVRRVIAGELVVGADAVVDAGACVQAEDAEEEDE